MTERDYQARMNRLTRLAFHLDDEAAANEAIALAGRAGDHVTGRRLLARFDREGVAAAVPYPKLIDSGYKAIRHRGIQLAWDQHTAVLYAACVAKHVLHIFEEAYPDDMRPRAAIEAAHAFVRGAIPAHTVFNAASAAYATDYVAKAAAHAAEAAAEAAEAAWAGAHAAEAAAGLLHPSLQIPLPGMLRKRGSRNGLLTFYSA